MIRPLNTDGAGDSGPSPTRLRVDQPEPITVDSTVPVVDSAIWLNPGKNTEEIRLTAQGVIWTDGRTTSPPNGGFFFKGSIFVVSFNWFGNEQNLTTTCLQKVGEISGVYRSSQNSVMCIFRRGPQNLRCDGTLRTAIGQVKAAFGAEKAFMWFHPKKDLSVVLVTRQYKVVFVSKAGVAGPANGEATISDADPDHIRFCFHAGGVEEKKETTYMKRVETGASVFRMDGYEQNGSKINVDPDRQRHWDWDIVAIEVNVNF